MNRKGQIVRTLRRHVAADSLPVAFVDAFRDEQGYERAVKLKIVDNKVYYDSEDEKLQEYLDDVAAKIKQGVRATKIQPWRERLEECGDVALGLEVFS